MRFHLSILLNWLFFLATIFALIIIQSSFINAILPSYVVPDFISIMVVYVGIKRGLGEGIFFTLVMSYLYSMNSSIEIIPASFFELMVLFAARYAGSNFYISTARDFMLTIAGIVFIQKFIISLWLNWGSWLIFLSFIPQTVSRTVVTAAVGLLVFKILYRIDVVTHRIELESVEDNRGLF
ncbi:MAG: hypothetical protein V1647_00865 [Pseudomonadota bacterium]